ncbi:hypothetical protein [Microbacterium sp. CIAB417]|uniref:hypothetical protein n=1 Tax=Microbacterium sp. CIAB417 TaxID=2860287 RepID=UPI001FABA4C5|nr:hypothetical protein [Microbacterium sp. CIAB417]
MGIDSDRNDISTEPSPDASENDNLGAQDGKGTPPTVPPNEDDDSVDAEDPADG